MEKKKVTLITGGASGIGEAISRQLARDGYSLHINYNRSSENFKKLKRELENHNVKITGTKADIRSPEECKKIIDECLQAHNGLGALILNAGVFLRGNPIDLSVEEIRQLVDTNLTSSLYLLKYAIPILRKVKGAIIFLGTGSIADSTPSSEYSCYAASKSGLYVMMRSLAVSEGKYGIRVNMVSPGMIDAGGYSQKILTKYKKEIPLGYLGKPNDIASVVSFLLSEEAKYISGANIDVSGGWVR